MNEDYQIITQIKSGDEKTIERFYNLHKSGFMQFAKKFEVSQQDVLDIYQDSVIALCENVRKGKLDALKSSLKTYFFAIGKYMLYAKFKSEKNQIAYDELQEINFEFIEDENLEENPQIKQLETAMEELGKTCKELLTLYYYDEKKLDEITQIMQYDNKDVAKSQKSRCLKKLKEIISLKS